MKLKKNINTGRFLPLLLSVCVAFAVFIYFTYSPPMQGNALAGNGKAGEFSLPDLSGKKISLESFRGRPVVLNFWATWCPPCVAELPALDKLFNEYRKHGVMVIGINVGEAAGKVELFVKKLGVSFKILLDEDGSVNQKYKIFGLPTTYFIDTEGEVKEKIIGGATYGLFKEKLESVL